jgi:hypothetical protein
MTAAERRYSRAWPTHGHLVEIDPASPVGQRWWHGRHSWARPEHGGFDPRRYEVHPIADPDAKSYVERHHYSRSYVAASRRYGIFLRTPDGPDLVGVAVFAVPAQARVLTNVFPDLAPYTQSLELGRFVLEGPPHHPDRPPPAGPVRAPANSETWFLRQCFGYLAADGIVGVVSFADPVPRIVAGRLLFAGHVGTIYQAKGAVLTGRSARRYVTILPDGTSLSDRALQISSGEYAEGAARSHGGRAAGPTAWSARSLGFVAARAIARFSSGRCCGGDLAAKAKPASVGHHRRFRDRFSGCREEAGALGSPFRRAPPVRRKTPHV